MSYVLRVPFQIDACFEGRFSRFEEVCFVVDVYLALRVDPCGVLDMYLGMSDIGVAL